MTENNVTGRLYRILTDVTNNIWDRLSYWKSASDVEFDDGDNLENNKPFAILQRSTAYSVGTIVYIYAAPSWVILQCTQAGTTAITLPSVYSMISSAGVVVRDGTARFTVYDKRSVDTLSNSQYTIPSMYLVNELDSQLSANGVKFYFDYHDGKYGYNISAGREIETFKAF